MAAFFYKNGGNWLKAKAVYYKNGGVWLKAKAIYYKSGGVWLKVFSAGFSSFTNSLLSATGLAVTNADVGAVELHLHEAGAYTLYATDATGVAQLAESGNWGAPTQVGAGALYQYRTTHQAGTNIGGHGSWATLGTGASWYFDGDNYNTNRKSTSFTLEVREAAGGAVMSSRTVTLQAWGTVVQ